ncbi:MAG: DegQ family serine endoprotease [Thermodesulfovibrionales bacterium]|nr:DegQ family serine endoprotease [Thermodesulfovibrionales bacterium]
MMIKDIYDRFFYIVSIITFLCTLLAFGGMANASVDESTEILGRLGDAMAKIAEQVKPSIVNISTTRMIKAQRHPFFDDPFFRRFFGDDPFWQQKRKVTNLGSGVIATSDGFILTNNHVIEGAEDILVKLSNNKEYKGKVVGTDKRSDLAVIKIDEKNLPTIKWGDSDKLRVGEIVLAIGNPYGLNQTITMGIISALGRSGIGITDYEDFIQTDAAINPGNSGGALINMKGELVGINTAIFSTTGGYQGIGFAIPANMAKTVMNSIVKQGKMVRGWLGVHIQPLTPELIKQFNLHEEYGVLLSDIVEGGPAEKAGLKRGDVIVEYGGRKVEGPLHLRNMVASTTPGQTVAIKVIRDGKSLLFRVKIEELPPEDQLQAVTKPTNLFRGIYVKDITEESLKRFGIKKKIKGVIVESIDPGSPAFERLFEGDIIVEINRQTVGNVAEFNSITANIKPEQDVLLSVVRGGSSFYVVIPADRK